MSNGMYCSASQEIVSLSSAAVITGRLIFLTMTALPDSEAATSLVLIPRVSYRRGSASDPRSSSMMAPSTMLSVGIGSVPNADTLKPLPTARSSTALTALDPMSRPTHAFDLPSPNTVMSYPVLCVPTCLASAVPGSAVRKRPILLVLGHRRLQFRERLTDPLTGVTHRTVYRLLERARQQAVAHAGAKAGAGGLGLTVPRKAGMIWVYRCLDLPDRVLSGQDTP